MLNGWAILRINAARVTMREDQVCTCQDLMEIRSRGAGMGALGDFFRSCDEWMKITSEVDRPHMSFGPP
eukprot:3769103-Pyramimonas_sp.AAC.1